MQTTTHRRLLAVTALLFAMGLVFAPAAHAQLEGVTEVVGGTTDTVSSEVAETVGDATGEVNETVEGDGQTSGSSSDPIEEVTGGVKKTVDKTANTVEETSDAVHDAAGSTQETVQEAAGELGGNAVGSIDRIAGGLVGTGSGAKGRSNDTRSPNDTSKVGSEVQVLGNSYEDALRNRRTEGSRLFADPATRDTVSSVEDSTGTSIVSQIGRVAAEVAQQVAFPLMLVMLVGGFLMVQNRIDRKDPKLAVAPVDSEHDRLSFS